LRLAARRVAIALRPSKTGPEDPRGVAPDRLGKSGNAGNAAYAGKLARKADFDAVYRNGKRHSSSHFTVFLKANELPQSRFGYSIKRALGGAVVRNRMRRRMREIVRLHREEISAGWDFVIHPKANVATAPFVALESALLRLLKP
jgi:ribonuclease P protein component